MLAVEIVGQDARVDARSRHPHSIAPRGFQANDLSLSHNALLPPGEPVMRGAASLIIKRDRMASPRQAGDSRSRSQPRSRGAERASLDGLAGVRPVRVQAVMAQLTFRERVRGTSSSTRSCITFGVICPCSPRSRQTEAVTLHRPQCPRQIGFGLAGNPRQLVEGTGRLLGNDTEQFSVASRQDLGERLRRGEPDLRPTRRDAPRATAMVRAFISS